MGIWDKLDRLANSSREAKDAASKNRAKEGRGIKFTAGS
jgi:hypothetical protein